MNGTSPTSPAAATAAGGRPALETHGPRRVLHVLDGLGGGGSEEWVRDIVALVPQEEFTFAVCYLYPSPERFQYTTDLRSLGALVTYVGPDDQWFAELWPSSVLMRFALRAVRSPYYRWIRPWSKHVVIFLRLWRAIRRFRPAVVHCHVFQAFVHGVLAARLAGVPVVVYTVPALRTQLEERYRWVFPAYRLLGRFVDRFFTAISVQELQRGAQIPADRITLFRGAVDFRRIRPTPRDRNPVVREFGLEGAWPIVLLTGRFNADKGQAVAVRAVQMLQSDFPRVRLILLGEGEDWRAVRDLVTRQALDGAVLLPGFRTDLECFYGLADIYWRTSLVEGMNRACFLAMAYALPIVGFDTRAATEVLTEGETALLVPPGDAAALAAASRRLLRAPDLARTLGGAAAELCRRDWDIAQAIRLFAEAYRGGER